MHKILDLFSGLGGFSLGLERTGCFKTIAFCDNDKFSKLILDKHWKGVKVYNDVREITKERFIADGIQFPDIITGGFPCQPFSVAGKQKGTSDDRHLWPEMFRIIKAFKPRYVIGENVRGIINIQDGVVFETVCTDLESEGYEVQPFIIPAAGVGAPHRRERVWIVAVREDVGNTQHNGSSTSTIEGSSATSSNDNEKGQNETSKFEGTGGSKDSKDVANSRRTLQQGTELGKTNEDEIREENADQFKRSGSTSESNVANATESRSSSESIGNIGGVGEESSQEEERRNQSSVRTSTRSTEESNDVADTYARLSDGTYEEVQSRGQTFDTSSQRTDVAYTESSNRDDYETISGDGGSPTQKVSRDGSSLSGEGSWWHVEPDVGRVAHGVPGRVYRLKGLGNSIVPKIAEEIGKAIIEAEREE